MGDITSFLIKYQILITLFFTKIRFFSTIYKAIELLFFLFVALFMFYKMKKNHLSIFIKFKVIYFFYISKIFKIIIDLLKKKIIYKNLFLFVFQNCDTKIF